MPHPPRAVLAAAAALALAVAPACSSDDDTTTTDTSSSSAVDDSASTSSTQAGSTSSADASSSTTGTGSPSSPTSASTTTSVVGNDLIRVTAPIPGSEVSSPFEVRGSASVFEGTVNYEVTGSDGEVLDSGFATAAVAEIGELAPFTITVDVGSAEGPVTLAVFEVSPEDGSRNGLVEVDLEVTAG